MKSRYLILILALTGVLVVGTLFADIYDDIANAVKSGSSKELARHFSSRVELKIGSNENIYSKAQAEMILNDFFEKNQPVNFNIKHKGASAKGLPYIIGDLQTSNGNYRAYFLFKQEGSSLFIQELHFDKE